MSSLGTCHEPSIHADYQALFSAAQGVTECFNQQQKNQFDVWMLHAVVANDLSTDDSFVFSKAVGKIKDAISVLPVPTVDDEVTSLAAFAESQSVTMENIKADDSSRQAAAFNNSGDEPLIPLV